jgi:hypothetical protein
VAVMAPKLLAITPNIDGENIGGMAMKTVA